MWVQILLDLLMKLKVNVFKSASWDHLRWVNRLHNGVMQLWEMLTPYDLSAICLRQWRRSEKKWWRPPMRNSSSGLWLGAEQRAIGHPTVSSRRADLSLCMGAIIYLPSDSHLTLCVPRAILYTATWNNLSNSTMVSLTQLVYH